MNTERLVNRYMYMEEASVMHKPCVFVEERLNPEERGFYRYNPQAPRSFLVVQQVEYNPLSGQVDYEALIMLMCIHQLFMTLAGRLGEELRAVERTVYLPPLDWPRDKLADWVFQFVGLFSHDLPEPQLVAEGAGIVNGGGTLNYHIV